MASHYEILRHDYSRSTEQCLQILWQEPRPFSSSPNPERPEVAGVYLQLKGNRTGTVTSAWSWMNEFVGEDYWETGTLGDQETEMTDVDGGAGSKKTSRLWLWTECGKVLVRDEEGKKIEPGKHLCSAFILALHQRWRLSLERPSQNLEERCRPGDREPWDSHCPWASHFISRIISTSVIGKISASWVQPQKENILGWAHLQK